MSVPTVLIDRLIEAGIAEAAIIDDVFDGPASIDIRTRLDGFREDVADDDQAVEELRVRYNLSHTGLVDINVVRALWKDISELAHLKKHVHLLISDYQVRLQMVERIASNLSSLGVSIHRFGDADKDPKKLPPDSIRLVLLDYSLAPDADSPNEASEWCATTLCARSTRRPFLVLISDHADAEAHKDSFRDKTNLLGGTFAFIPKQQAQEANLLYFQIATWGLGHPAHTYLQAFVEASMASLEETIAEFRRTVSALTVQDYSFLQRFCLDKDGQPLGEYMLEFFTGLLSHQFRANQQIQDSRRALDSLSFDSQLACVTKPSAQLAKMHRLAQTEPVLGDIGPHPQDLAHYPVKRQIVLDAVLRIEKIARAAYEIWESEGRPSGREEQHWGQAESQLSYLPLLGLGDIFIKNAGSKLWMVVNAACDLLFAPRSSDRQARPEQPIYLIPGEFSSLHAVADTGSKEVTELFEHEGRVYRILWDYRYVRSIALRDFENEMRTSGYRRTARLTLPYALKVQRAWTAHLDRVGLPSPPPIFEEASVSMYLSQAPAEWVKLSGPLRGGAVLARRKAGHGYEEVWALTIEGDESVTIALDAVIQSAEEQTRELERQAGQDDCKKNYWPDKIRRSRAIHESLIAVKHDLEWRLNLLEHPRLVSKATRWAVNDLIAVYFDAIPKEFAKQARLVINITR